MHETWNGTGIEQGKRIGIEQGKEIGIEQGKEIGIEQAGKSFVCIFQEIGRRYRPGNR